MSCDEGLNKIISVPTKAEPDIPQTPLAELREWAVKRCQAGLTIDALLAKISLLEAKHEQD